MHVASVVKKKFSLWYSIESRYAYHRATRAASGGANIIREFFLK